MADIVCTSEPFGSDGFVEKANRAAGQCWAAFLQAQEYGGYYNLNGAWKATPGGPVYECRKGDDGAVMWLFTTQVCALDGIVDEMVTAKYFKRGSTLA